MTRARYAKSGVARREIGARATRCALACALVLSACLVTQEVQYETVNNAPAVRALFPEEITVRVPSATQRGCEPGEMAFTVAIEDLDPERELWWRVYLNDDVLGPIPGDYGGRVPNGSDTKRRPFEPICIKKQELERSARRCNRLSVLVTSNFDKVGAGVPRRTNDFESNFVEWQVLPRSDVDPAVDVNDCTIESPDAGLPPAGSDAGATP